MTDMLNLLRPNIRQLRPYRSAEFEDGLARLNANENPWRPPGDTSVRGINWYPEPRPVTLQRRLASHYGVEAEQLLVTRGSSEGIDLLIRGFCRDGIDAVVICPPTFGMYEVYAQVQGARIRTVPLDRNSGYDIDVDAILDGWSDTDRLLFVCSPNNPTGNSFAQADLARLATGIRGRGCLVLDAAYAEFSDNDPSPALLATFDNVVVLRTLSKAMALAGVRCGALLGQPDVIEALGRALPPYTFPAPCAEAIERCLEPENAAECRRRIAVIKRERTRLTGALAALKGILRVWPSDANFLLVEVEDAARVAAAARAGGVLLRDFSWDARLPGCIRITIGTPEQNDRLLRILGDL